MSTAPVQDGAPTSQRERQRIETRERLFEAALDEFRRVGFAEAQIPAIAEAAGVVRGTFYFHFPSKEDVLHELIARREADLVGALRALEGTGASLETIVGCLMRAMEPEEAGEGSSELVRETAALQLRTPLDRDARPQGDGVFEALQALFADLAARGEIRRDMPVAPQVAMVITSVFGMAVARASAPEDERPPNAEQLLALLLPGLRPPA